MLSQPYSHFFVLCLICTIILNILLCSFYFPCQIYRSTEKQKDNSKLVKLCEKVKSDIKTLQNEADHLEHLTALVQQGIEGFVTDEHVQKHAYVTQQDLLSIQDLKEQMKFTVKAPAGATLTVPVPNMKVQFRIVITCD